MESDRSMRKQVYQIYNFIIYFLMTNETSISWAFDLLDERNRK